MKKSMRKIEVVLSGERLITPSMHGGAGNGKVRPDQKSDTNEN